MKTRYCQFLLALTLLKGLHMASSHCCKRPNLQYFPSVPRALHLAMVVRTFQAVVQVRRMFLALVLAHCSPALRGLCPARELVQWSLVRLRHCLGVVPGLFCLAMVPPPCFQAGAQRYQVRMLIHK